MSSFPYLAPTIPDRWVLADMLVWFTSPEMRRELMATGWDLEQTPLDDLVDETIRLLETWQPATEYQWLVVRKARVLDWLVWQTAQAADVFWEQSYQDLDMIEPWAVTLETLPVYGQRPTAIVEAD